MSSCGAGSNRSYQKKVDEENVERRTAYEISVSKLGVWTQKVDLLAGLWYYPYMHEAIQCISLQVEEVILKKVDDLWRTV